MWEAIKYVSSATTLIAFIFAVSAWTVRQQMLVRERKIALAPESERAGLLEREIEYFKIDTAQLTRQQQYDLAIRQIEARAQRFRIIAMVVSLLTATAGIVTLYAVGRADEAVEAQPATETQAIGSESKDSVEKAVRTIAPDSTLVRLRTQNGNASPIVRGSVRLAPGTRSPYLTAHERAFSLNALSSGCRQDEAPYLTCEFRLFHTGARDLSVRLHSDDSIVVDSNGVDHPAISVRLGRQTGLTVSNSLPAEIFVAGAVTLDEFGGALSSTLPLLRVKFSMNTGAYLLEFRNVRVNRT